MSLSIMVSSLFYIALIDLVPLLGRYSVEDAGINFFKKPRAVVSESFARAVQLRLRSRPERPDAEGALRAASASNGERG
jgi:hypothetical protein